MTLELDWLKRWAGYSPRAVALQCAETGVSRTYADLYQQSQNLACALRDRFAVSAGDRVACLAHNELEYVSLFFALQRLNAILVPINFRFTASEAEHVIKDSGAKLVIAQKALWEIVAPLRSSHMIWNFDGPESMVEACVHLGPAVPHAGVFTDPCMILYTSGTTGFPKGAMITPHMIHWNSINTGLRLNLTQNDVVATFLPLFHTGGWNVLTTPCLHRGAKVVLLKKFDPDLLLKVCAREKVSVLFGVPTTMDFLIRAADFAATDLSSLRYAVVGGEPMPVQLIQTWETRGVPIRQGYGLTEFGPNVFSLNQEDSRRKMGSIGFPNFYIEARVMDAGRELGAGEVGELELKGPVAMSGYWNNPQATAECIVDGWLRTGDLVRRDEEGYYYVVGRKKEMYISGGENVYPAEVEKVLRQMPGVREVAVIGVAHPKWGESGKAFVALESCVSLSPEEMREHCLKNLAKFKVPIDFVILSQLPKTESGKIARHQLR